MNRHFSALFVLRGVDVSGSEVLPQDLSSSETEAATVSDMGPRRRGAARKWFEKRNEKGETALHTACIAGNLKRVKTLVQKVSK